MQVPAAGVKSLQRRPAHEGREITEAAADLPCRGAEQEYIIGRLERGARRKCALDLSRAPFILDRAQPEPELLESIAERVEHGLHQIHVGFGVIVVAGLYRPSADRVPACPGHADIVVAQMVFGDAEQIPLDLRADDAGMSAFGKLL